MWAPQNPSSGTVAHHSPAAGTVAHCTEASAGRPRAHDPRAGHSTRLALPVWGWSRTSCPAPAGPRYPGIRTHAAPPAAQVLCGLRPSERRLPEPIRPLICKNSQYSSSVEKGAAVLTTGCGGGTAGRRTGRGRGCFPTSTDFARMHTRGLGTTTARCRGPPWTTPHSSAATGTCSAEVNPRPHQYVIVHWPWLRTAATGCRQAGCRCLLGLAKSPYPGTLQLFCSL